MEKKESSVAVPGYELDRQCGQGACSEVWIAYDPHGVRRALRIVRKQNFSTAVPEKKRFASYRAFSEEDCFLLHFLYAGETEECFYYVSDAADNIRGESRDPCYEADTLEHRLMCRRYSLPEILCCILDILSGLEHLHKQDLAHNDLKPGNILFLRNQLTLADPGLLHPSGGKIRSGTAAFRPEWEAAGTEADIYALGKIIYCMITGCCDPGSFPELAAGNLSESFFSLNEIALRCCEADPRIRYRSCAEIRRDVLQLLHRKGSVRKNHPVSFRLICFLIALSVLQSLFLSVSLCCSFSRQPEKKLCTGRKKQKNLCRKRVFSGNEISPRCFLDQKCMLKTLLPPPLFQRDPVSTSGERPRNDV